MKIIAVVLVVLTATGAFAAGIADEPDRPERRVKQFNQVLTFGIGLHHRDGDTGSGFRTAVTIGWDGWLTRSRIFGFYFDGTIVLEEPNSLGEISYGVNLSFPLAGPNLRSFVQLGFGYGKDENGEEFFSMPVTVGTSFWFTRSFGLKFSFRYYLLCKEDMLHMSAGLFAAL
mgnify:CR=1 FL=1